jgi:hypothetical protein
MTEFFISNYHDYDYMAGMFEITDIFRKVTDVEPENIYDYLPSPEYDLELEVRLEKDKFGMKVNSKMTTESISRVSVNISFYYDIDDTIHKHNVKKMFDNWANSIQKEYELVVNQYNKEYQIVIQDEINEMKVADADSYS